MQICPVRFYYGCGHLALIHVKELTYPVPVVIHLQKGQHNMMSVTVTYNLVNCCKRCGKADADESF
mgnify:CR=1 FL=1